MVADIEPLPVRRPGVPDESTASLLVMYHRADQEVLAMHENIAKSQYEVPAQEATKRAEFQAANDRRLIDHHARMSSWAMLVAVVFGSLAYFQPAMSPVAIAAMTLAAGPAFIDSIARMRRKPED